MSGITIAPARTDRDIAAMRDLFLAYAQFLEDDFGIDLAFQDFEEELASLPGKYAPPSGEMLLARTAEGTEVGCIAFRPHDAHSCEIKRLYVLPAARGHALGRRLVERLIEVARERGYSRIVLDTGDKLVAAMALYETLGFSDIAPFNDSPLDGMRYMALDL